MSVFVSLTRRVGRVEQATHADMQKRYRAALNRTYDTLELEHRQQLAAWFAQREPCPSGHLAKYLCQRCIDEGLPPTLLRAIWVMLAGHLKTGAPVGMWGPVARVYASNPDAWPANPCESCGYLLPMQARLRADRTYRFLGTYEGQCPSCWDGGDDTAVCI